MRARIHVKFGFHLASKTCLVPRFGLSLDFLTNGSAPGRGWAGFRHYTARLKMGPTPAQIVYNIDNICAAPPVNDGGGGSTSFQISRQGFLKSWQPCSI